MGEHAFVKDRLLLDGWRVFTDRGKVGESARVGLGLSGCLELKGLSGILLRGRLTEVGLPLLQCEDHTAVRGMADHHVLYSLFLGQVESVAVDGEESELGLAR